METVTFLGGKRSRSSERARGHPVRRKQLIGNVSALFEANNPNACLDQSPRNRRTGSSRSDNENINGTIRHFYLLRKCCDRLTHVPEQGLWKFI